MKYSTITTKLLTATVMLALFSSCKKATVDYFNSPVITGGVPKIKTIDYGNKIRTNFYDESGRFTKATYSDGASSTATYSPNAVVFDSYNTLAALTQKDLYVLGADGLVTSSTNSNNATSTFYYYYNANKNLIYDTYISSGVLVRERFYQYVDGNLMYDSLKENGYWSTHTYERFMDINSTTEQNNLGVDVLGQTSKNALKKVITKTSTGNVTTRVYEVPKTDAAGRISKVTYSENGNTPVSTSYTYY